jgi:hypothetical protein
MPPMPVWILLALLAATPACADEHRAARIWLNPGLYSHHFRQGDFRGDNYGPGVEIDLAAQHAFLAGSFINSDRERSHYATYYWRPWRRKLADIDLSAGVVAGVFDGYSSVNRGGWFPAALPAASIEYRFIGANLAFIPHPRNGAALALQLKLRVW